MIFLLILLSSFDFFTKSAPKTVLEIVSDETCNGGMPVYVFVKEVEKGEFLIHNYPDIVKEAAPFSEKHTAFSQVILPGRKCQLEITRQNPEKLLGVYFLFTNPGEDWKLLTDATQNVELVLGENQIAKIRKNE